MKKEIKRDSNGRFVKKTANGPGENVNYKSICERQKLHIEELRMERDKYMCNAKMYKDKYLSELAHSVTRVGLRDFENWSLKSKYGIAKDGMYSALHWNFWLCGRLSWFKRLLWRKELRAMDEEMSLFIDALKGLGD